mmetsp:Transcript_3641/g.4880  ORF Transcript_3641/g.4880 Transcript_3641/m.4880 type:complete len:620 (+) Transcript_3641:69-1928(+)
MGLRSQTQQARSWILTICFIQIVLLGMSLETSLFSWNKKGLLGGTVLVKRTTSSVRQGTSPLRFRLPLFGKNSFRRALRSPKKATLVLEEDLRKDNGRLLPADDHDSKDCWTPDSWRRKNLKAEQQPPYAPQHLEALEEAIQTISSLPPLVQHWETKQLRHRLAEVFHKKRFVLQAGDCAEQFKDCCPKGLESRVKVLEQMRFLLERVPRILSEDKDRPKLPVTVIRRAAGQYGKPRSSNYEEVGGLKMVAFKGDNVNALEAEPSARMPKPERLVEGCLRAQCTMNYLRSRLGSPNGLFEYTQSIKHWQTASLSPDAAQGVRQALRCGDFDNDDDDDDSPGEGEGRKSADPTSSAAVNDLHEREVYTSHEGLLLNLEEAMTRPVPAERVQEAEDSKATSSSASASSSSSSYYNSGAHFLWIGTRTKQLDGAHTEYFRGIDNPVGIKVGSDIDPETAVALVKRVDPDNQPGKIVLISRFGADDVNSGLSKLAKAIQRENLHVVWFVDPMHGNTRKTKNGQKTRDFHRIFSEIEQTHALLKKYDQHLGGIHLELCGEDVTECVGGGATTRDMVVCDEDLPKNWKSACDPRLNYGQSIELAYQVSALLARDRDYSKITTNQL